MGLCSFFSVALFGVSVQAIAFPGPSPTNDIYAIQEDGWTPMPTAPPGVHEVLRRQNSLASTFIMAPDNTCGFVSGRSNCAFRVSCIDSADMRKSCDRDCQRDSLTLKCTGTARFCNTVAFPLGVTDYYCATRRIARAHHLIFDQVEYSQVYQDINLAYIDDSARANAATSSSADLVAAPAPAPAPPAGAIVGGVIGGVALLAMIIFGAIFLRQRQQRHLQALQAAALTGQNQHPMSEPPFQPQPPAAPFAQSSPYSAQTPSSPAQSHQFAAQTYGAAAAGAIATSAAGSAGSSFSGPPTSNYPDYYQPTPMSTPSPQPTPAAYHTYQHQQQDYQQQPQDQPWVTPPDRADTSTPQSIRNASPVTPASALSAQPADYPGNRASNAAGVVPLALQPGMGSWQQRYRTESLSSSSAPSVVNGRPIIPYSPAVREQQQAQRQMSGEGLGGQAPKQSSPQEGGGGGRTTAAQGEPAELP
ncbi:hypothetical protein MMYC01_209658 [Madurella mycetomatis]|uniref:Transmembrane protein n=1 Tax=Madurella mycetomatis TaxID=100816 RepID=A0A175VU34_9PEZI|nr:hypothetical protein MMYC01_209658 [Madurella mycetomatis]